MSRYTWKNRTPYTTGGYSINAAIPATTEAALTTTRVAEYLHGTYTATSANSFRLAAPDMNSTYAAMYGPAETISGYSTANVSGVWTDGAPSKYPDKPKGKAKTPEKPMIDETIPTYETPYPEEWEPQLGEVVWIVGGEEPKPGEAALISTKSVVISIERGNVVQIRCDDQFQSYYYHGELRPVVIDAVSLGNDCPRCTGLPLPWRHDNNCPACNYPDLAPRNAAKCQHLELSKRHGKGFICEEGPITSRCGATLPALPEDKVNRIVKWRDGSLTCEACGGGGEVDPMTFIINNTPTISYAVTTSETIDGDAATYTQTGMINK